LLRPDRVEELERELLIGAFGGAANIDLHARMLGADRGRI
jgi:hypothetical protein